VPSVAVGRNLQTHATIKLSAPAPETGFKITVRSDDPTRLLLSLNPEVAGSDSITLTLNSGLGESPDFWLQALRDEGEVTYTASAAGFGETKGVVTLSRSAITLVGPFRAPSFPTTPRAEPSRLVLFPMRLDASLKPVEQQAIAGGLPVEAELAVSDEAVGKVNPARITIAGGAPNATADFQPAAAGTAILSVVAPAGFHKPAESASITAQVRTPGIVITDNLMIGENLQLGGMVGLGEAAPAAGIQVTLTSGDPKRLLLSRDANEVGSSQITLPIEAGKVSARFYLQALGRAGQVTYTATAPGFATRTANVNLAPSGVVVTVSEYGPPDEAELLRADAAETPRGFVASLSKPRKTPLVVWTAQLDPVTGRCADVTVQPLRAGLTLNVDLKTTDPAVGKVNSPVVIPAGLDHAGSEFIPQGVGSTEVVVVTPAGFTTAKNSTTVSAIVRQ
jgi:hypothetical protein